MVPERTLALVVLPGMNRRDGDGVRYGRRVGQRCVDGGGVRGTREGGTGGRRVVENSAERHGADCREGMRDKTRERKIGECKNEKRRAVSGLCQRVSRQKRDVTGDVVGDKFTGCKWGEGCWGRRARCCGGCREHKGGRWREMRRYFVLLDLARIGRLPNSATRSTPSSSAILGRRAGLTPSTKRLPTTSYSTPVRHTRSLRLVRIQHQLWSYFFVKFLRRQIPKCHRCRLQCRSLFVCFLGAPRDVWNLPVSEKNRIHR